MPVKSTLVKSTYTIKYKDGVNTSGNDIIKAKKFSNVKVTASNESIYEVVATFAPLMRYPVTDGLRTDDKAIVIHSISNCLKRT